ncbi:MAG: hypothetical protein ACFFAN_13495 [Promethearchaeota archaeon]
MPIRESLKRELDSAFEQGKETINESKSITNKIEKKKKNGKKALEYFFLSLAVSCIMAFLFFGWLGIRHYLGGDFDRARIYLGLAVGFLILAIIFGVIAQSLGDGKPSEPSEDCKKILTELKNQTEILKIYLTEKPRANELWWAYSNRIEVKIKKRGREIGQNLIPQLGTDPSTCNIIPSGAQRDEVYERHFANLPIIAWEAALAHEKSHKRICDSFGRPDLYGRWLDEDPVNHQKDEVLAYTIQLKMLMNWMKSNCL